MATKTGLLSGSLRSRLLFGTTALATLPLIVLALVLAYFATQQAAQSLDSRANDQLQSIRVGKQEEINSYFEGLADTMVIVARSSEAMVAVKELPVLLETLPAALPVPIDQARAAVGDYYRRQFAGEYAKRNAGAAVETDTVLSKQSDVTVAAQYFYIADNPNPLGEKGKLDAAAGDASAYTTQHARFHSFGRALVERFGLYDMFLVDLQGNVVYTFFKELDYASNLETGPWAKSGLAEAYVHARNGAKAGEVRLTDYAPYVPSYEDQATFASTPMYEGERQVGVLIVQVPIDRVNAIMTFEGNWQEVGLGASGEVYLIGADKTPRSISRFMKEDPSEFVQMMKGLGIPADRLARMSARASNVGLMTIDTVGSRDSIAGKSGVGVYPDYRGIPVLGAYAPLQILNQNWGILSEIDVAEASTPVVALRKQIALVALIALITVAAIAVLIALRLSRSISNENEQLNDSVVDIMTAVAELAGRNLDIKVPVSANVTGVLSDAINMMTRSTAGALGRVRQISNTVSVASESVRQSSEHVHGVATSASNQATAASAELQQNAIALREMGDQARDANQFAERAIKATGDALDVVRATVSGIFESRDQIRETEKRVKRLGERSQEITAVVNIIGQIAERTSVLALNASMQAVAAGDAGRGFAVVADEVKRLAENARQATQQISSLVHAIQADTSETIQAMNGTIAQVVEISKLADKAGGQMNDTRATTEQLAAAVRNIAVSTQTQSTASQTLITRALELMQSSQRTMEELSAQRKDTDALAHSAQELVNTVSEFRLPA